MVDADSQHFLWTALHWATVSWTGRKPRTGKLRPECKECASLYRKERYLSSEQRRKLGPILRFILEEGDEHAGMICPDCRQPCRIGDEVIASDAVLHHASHHEVGEP